MDSISSMVAAAAVDDNGIVSPGARAAAPVASAGGCSETNTSPSGVADLSSAAVPTGTDTSSVMRMVTIAEYSSTRMDATSPTSAPASFTLAFVGRLSAFSKVAWSG